MSPAGRELPDFVRVEQGKRVALVHPDFMVVSSALLNEQGASPTGAIGRGQLLQVLTARGDVLIRKYLRGGLIARVLKNIYTLDNRPLRELCAHMQAWRKGVPTVMPIGAAWERPNLFHAIAFATLREDAEDLLQYVQTHPNPDAAVLAACGHAIRAMHRADIYHADLQVKNILIAKTAALIIDFDKARVRQVTQAMAEQNFARLKRSFIKRGLPLKAFDEIVAGYFNSNDQHRDTEDTGH